MKKLPLLLKDEFITNDISSMLEERGFQFAEKHLNDYYFKNHQGSLVVVEKEDEVLVLDRTTGELPFIYVNTSYRKLDEDTVQKRELIADISDNFNFYVTTRGFLNIPFRGGYFEMEQVVEDFVYSEDKIKRVLLDLRVRDGFSILKQLNEIGIQPNKEVSKLVRKITDTEDFIYDGDGNLIKTVFTDSIFLNSPSNYHK